MISSITADQEILLHDRYVFLGVGLLTNHTLPDGSKFAWIIYPDLSPYAFTP
jgi:hypothetical protein